MAVQRFLLKQVATSGGSDARRRAYLLESTGATDDTPDDVAALDWAELNSPLLWDGMPREGFQIDHLKDSDPEYWQVTALYQRASDKKREESKEDPVGTVDFAFDFGLASVRITTAPEQISYGLVGEGLISKYAGKGQPINNRVTNGISEPEGVDVRTPIASFTLTATAESASLNEQYITQAQKMVGKVNSAPFRGWQSGEVMLVNIRGRQRLAGNSEISFQFEVIPNSTVEIDNLETFQKDGWDYLWVDYIDKIADDDRDDKVADSAHVSKLYGRVDLNDLFPNFLLGTIGGVGLATLSGQPMRTIQGGA